LIKIRVDMSNAEETADDENLIALRYDVTRSVTDVCRVSVSAHVRQKRLVRSLLCSIGNFLKVLLYHSFYRAAINQKY